jgi:glycerol-1-phosphate dehydrogenase [NAD(P)+]
MSHYFEVVGIMRNEPYFHHGIDVVYSAVFVQKLREQILALGTPNVEAEFDRTKWECKIREVYDDAAEGVIALQDKLGWYDNSRASIYADKWDAIKNILSEAPSSEEMQAYLDSIELDINEYKDTYKAEKLQNAMWFSKDLKDRYTVLWLYFSLFYRW